MTTILLLHLSNQSLLIISMNLYSIMNYHKDLVDFLLVLEKRLVLMEKMLGEYLESINLKRLNNLLFVILRKVGLNFIRWLVLPKSFINL